MNNLTIKDELTEFLLYTTPNNDIKVETYLHNETLWLSQKRIAELFGVDRTVVTKHLKNIFTSGELEEDSVSAKIAHTEYEEFNKIQKIESDFDKEIKKILKDKVLL